MFDNVIDKTIFDLSEENVYSLLLKAIANNSKERKVAYIVPKDMESTLKSLSESLEKNNNIEIFKITDTSSGTLKDRFNISLKDKCDTTTEIKLISECLLPNGSTCGCGERCDYFIIDTKDRFTKSIDSEFIKTIIPLMMYDTPRDIPFGGITLLYGN